MARAVQNQATLLEPEPDPPLEKSLGLMASHIVVYAGTKRTCGVHWERTCGVHWDRRGLWCTLGTALWCTLGQKRHVVYSGKGPVVYTGISHYDQRQKPHCTPSGLPQRTPPTAEASMCNLKPAPMFTPTAEAPRCTPQCEPRRQHPNVHPQCTRGPRCRTPMFWQPFATSMCT